MFERNEKPLIHLWNRPPLKKNPHQDTLDDIRSSLKLFMAILIITKRDHTKRPRERDPTQNRYIITAHFGRFSYVHLYKAIAVVVMTNLMLIVMEPFCGGIIFLHSHHKSGRKWNDFSLSQSLQPSHTHSKCYVIKFIILVLLLNLFYGSEKGRNFVAMAKKGEFLYDIYFACIEFIQLKLNTIEIS